MSFNRGENFQGEEFRPYVAALGQLALAWNDLHEHLADLFAVIMEGVGLAKAYEVWRSSTQDRAAREMLRACVLVHREDPDQMTVKAADEILWLLAQIEALEESRNNAVHSPLWAIIIPGPITALRWERRIEPQSSLGHRRARKLAKKPDLLAEFIWCRDMALVLRDYARELERQLQGAQKKFPERPSLPNRGQK